MTDKKGQHDESEVPQDVVEDEVEQTEVGDVAELETAEEPVTLEPEAQKSSSSARLVIAMAIAFVVGLVAAGYWGWRQGEMLRVEVAELGSRSSQELRASLALQEQQANALREDLDAALVAAGDAQAALVEQLEILNLRLTEAEQSQPKTLVIAEVGYLLQLASNRLELESDRPGALLALDRALGRLELAASPTYARLVSTIVAERVAIDAVTEPELSAIINRLSGLIAGVDTLTSGTEKLTPDAPDSAGASDEVSVEGFASAVVGNLRQFITIKRADGSAPPTLIPDQDYYIRENVRLSLQVARSAVLRADEQTYRFGLEEARSWLAKLGSAAPIQALDAELDELLGAELSVNYPTLAGSLAIARQLSAEPHNALQSIPEMDGTSTTDESVSTQEEATEAEPEDAAEQATETLSDISAPAAADAAATVVESSDELQQ